MAFSNLREPSLYTDRHPVTYDDGVITLATGNEILAALAAAC